MSQRSRRGWVAIQPRCDAVFADSPPKGSTAWPTCPGQAASRVSPRPSLAEHRAGQEPATGASALEGPRRAAGRRRERAGGVDAGHTHRRSPQRRYRRAPLPGPPDPAEGGGEMAPYPILDDQQGSRVRRKTTMIVGLYTDPPADAVVVCADELGPIVPRTFPPGPAWSADGQRIKAPLDYARSPDKTWVYGALRVADGSAPTMTAPSRNSACYQQFLQQVEDANPGDGDIWVIAGRGLLAQPARSLVAYLPAARSGRSVLRRPQRHRLRHHPTQPTGQTLDVGTAATASPTLSPRGTEHADSPERADPALTAGRRPSQDPDRGGGRRQPLPSGSPVKGCMRRVAAYLGSSR